MTPVQQQKAAKAFAERWEGKGYEKGESQIFWTTLLTEIFGVELPIVVELEITECEPGVRGDTTNNATKIATLETGATVEVPLIVNQNEVIRVDTRTGEYLERA